MGGFELVPHNAAAKSGPVPAELREKKQNSDYRSERARAAYQRANKSLRMNFHFIQSRGGEGFLEKGEGRRTQTGEGSVLDPGNWERLILDENLCARAASPPARDAVRRLVVL